MPLFFSFLSFFHTYTLSNKSVGDVLTTESSTIAFTQKQGESFSGVFCSRNMFWFYYCMISIQYQMFYIINWLLIKKILPLIFFILFQIDPYFSSNFSSLIRKNMSWVFSYLLRNLVISENLMNNGLIFYQFYLLWITLFRCFSRRQTHRIPIIWYTNHLHRLLF